MQAAFSDKEAYATSPVKRRLYSMAETQKLLGGISRTTVWRLRKAGKIRLVTVGGRKFCPDDEIDRVVNTGL